MSQATENLEKMLAETPASMSARLSFPDQCAAFYALFRGFKPGLVAKVFGTTPTAMSVLKHCIRDPRRYRHVKDEFYKLGPEEFGEKYYTDDIDARLSRFRAKAEKSDDLMRGRGPNATADKFQGLWLIVDEQGDEHTVEVLWIDGEGWRHREFGRWAYVSRNIYQTSLKAREAAYANYLAQRLERRRA